MKFLTFELKNGDVYGLPLKLIAENRAKYYAENDPDTTFEEEVEFVMNDDFEAGDWYWNNCNPEDFPEESYILLKRGKPESLFEKITDCDDYNIEDYNI